ncbi:hypothetical protein FRB93_005673 [Tulasnella sp. JGI-2019a]|nr:hypothetical protein FRB93_005673 [Tulasnella sp. JGI-2019a]
MAAIYMRNVPDSTTDVSLQRDLAKILHDAPFNRFTSGERMNFHVFLLRKQGNRARGHRGIGVLTLPTTETAKEFISIYGRRTRPSLPCDYTGGRGQFLVFERSRKEPDASIVTYILQTPYVDPQVVQEKREREAKLYKGVGLLSLQLGWRCRDDAFSIEWDAHKDFIHTLPSGETALGGLTLHFVEDTREIVIAFPSIPVPSDNTADGLRGPPTPQIVFRWNRVQSVVFEKVSRDRPAIIFSLYRAPHFEYQTVSLGLHKDVRIIRQPCTAFLGTHGRIAPFASLEIRAECASPSDLDKFEQMAEVASLPSAMQIYVSPVKRRLFSVNALGQFDRWVAGLEWPIAFQLVAIRDNRLANPIELYDLQPYVATLKLEHGVPKTGEILRLFRQRLVTLGEKGVDQRGAVTILDCLSKTENDVTALYMSLRSQAKNPGYFNCYHVTVTPTRIICDGPFPDQSNRVLRRYPNNTNCFLRVQFTDEDLLDFRWDWNVQGAAFVRERVGGVLKSGLAVAGRQFKFLLFSQSALKEHAVWFCMPFVDSNGLIVDAEKIRNSLGDFRHLERQPARMAARMSQAFTATEPSVTLELEEMFVAPDIERNNSNFTDGLGDISRELANRIAKSLQSSVGGRKRFYVTPSAYQFRMGGFKGVIAVDYKLQGMEIMLRKSQKKFESPGLMQIEIAQAFYRPKPMYLNRNLVMILETLGVPAKVFIDLQDEAVDDIETATQSLRDCATHLLDMHGCGTSFRLSSVFLSLSKLGIGLRDEAPLHVLNDEFINRAIEFAANHVLRVIKHKARIPVKGSCTLVGVADIHGYLAPDEVFVCIKERDKATRYLEGMVLVTRSPQAHPGDVQFAHAIGAPPADSPFTRERNPRHNCIVFSTRGMRSLPSMLSGGDLDGDEFNVICNPELFPPSCDPPAEYPPAIIKTLDRPCDINDIADWVAEYINSDILGLISQELLVRADQSQQSGLMAREAGCLKLAALASAAVDFAKSGTPVSKAEIPPPLYLKGMKPDWAIGEMGAARSGQLTYASQTAIGKLFRRIDLNDADRLADRQARREHKPPKARPRNNKRVTAARHDMDGLVREMERLNLAGIRRVASEDPISFAVRDLLRRYIDVDSSIQPETTDLATEQFRAYVNELKYICATSTLSTQPLTEEEVLVGTIATKTSQPKKRQNLMSQLRLQADELVKRIRAELAGEGTMPHDFDDDVSVSAATTTEAAPEEIDLEEWLLRSWVAWHISTRQGENFGAKSFGIIALGSIFECVRELDERERLAGGI